MSHVADALVRAKRGASTADAFSHDDHPWAGQLPLTAAADPASPPWAGHASQDRHDEEELIERPRLTAQRPGSRPLAERQAVEDVRHVPGADAAVRQQISGLVDRLFLSPGGAAPRSLGVAGFEAGPQAGRVVALVADNLAQRTNARVAVVDLNFEAPSLHDWFAVALSPGAGHALMEDTPLLAVSKRLRSNLWLCPAGNGSPGELSERALARLQQLRDTFDHVILNLEPLTSGSVPAVDGLVVAISADTTRRETVRSAVERLQAAGAKVLGAVLTERRFPIPEAIYRRL